MSLWCPLLVLVRTEITSNLSHKFCNPFLKKKLRFQGENCKLKITLIKKQVSMGLFISKFLDVW